MKKLISILAVALLPLGCTAGPADAPDAPGWTCVSPPFVPRVKGDSLPLNPDSACTETRRR